MQIYLWNKIFVHSLRQTGQHWSSE